MPDAKRLKKVDENQGLLRMKEMSRYDIKNALTKKYMPLSDNIHGPYCMMPPELLHTSGSGLIKYMLQMHVMYIKNRLQDGFHELRKLGVFYGLEEAHRYR